MKPKKALAMLSALAQENRMNIFRLLIREGPEGLSAGTIAEILQVAPATLSFHLGQMETAGLLRSSRQGRVVMYAAKRKSAKRLLRFLMEGAYQEEGQEGIIHEEGDDGDDD